MVQQVDYSDDAQEAIEIINFLKNNGGVSETENIFKAESFIKSSGTVSDQFLQTLRQKKEELKSRIE